MCWWRHGTYVLSKGIMDTVYWANGAQIIPHTIKTSASILKNLEPWIKYDADDLAAVTSNAL